MIDKLWNSFTCERMNGLTLVYAGWGLVNKQTPNESKRMSLRQTSKPQELLAFIIVSLFMFFAAK